jgi:hypothetical protein
MAKRKEQVPVSILKEQADRWLAAIRDLQSSVDRTVEKYNAEIANLVESRDECVRQSREMIEARDAALLKLMKQNKAVLFDGTDLVNLNSGRLIYSKEDKVKIPRTALDSCYEHGFIDVIKIVESLDREAVEKWTDEKLFLIGATRKPKETFNYEVKQDKKES